MARPPNSSCGQVRVLIATRAHRRPPLRPPTSPGTTPPVDPNARPDPESGGRGRLTALEVCGACAGSPHTYLCRRCQGGEEPYRGGVCVRCAAHDHLRAAFADEDGRLDPAAATLVHALADSRRPRSVLEWLRRPTGGAALLRDILHRGVPLTHEVLDEHDPRAVWTLRHPTTSTTPATSPGGPPASRRSQRRTSCASPSPAHSCRSHQPSPPCCTASPSSPPAWSRCFPRMRG
jgi:hypothetical protein